ncbi:VanW family protein [Arsenicicoccus piscis]|uniref:Vancomycin resistance protein n=1 Tax=Arsenicicoccus piscis TaxID=673954 RepID=A0ABQ6HVY9_9MICO|nr:VanW family protein [Arsenicicoccus piscis]GMA21863.1 hypothetical protein GCM10025862_38840 [Arsenicicoccus piscis]
MRAFQARRHVQWALAAAFSSLRWAQRAAAAAPDLPVKVKAHASLLLRTVVPQDQMWLQHNKVHNLRLACARIDGIVVRPGETFSFNKVVGSCIRRRGYVDGMRLSNGTAHPGVGGGICQLANLIHWMVLHSPLTVVERSEHSFEPFPDNGRVLPWGVGCSIVYNYVDLAFRNDTDQDFQLRCRVGPRLLEGELRSELPTSVSYKVGARDERFEQVGDEVYRSNEIWRTLVDKRTGRVVGEELVKRNRALVAYDTADLPIEHSDRS